VCHALPLAVRERPWFASHVRVAVGSGLIVLLVTACGESSDADEARWQELQRDVPGALLSVWGTSAEDVWAAGAVPAPGESPTVLHYDGAGWSSFDTGSDTNLWWVYGFEGGPVYFGGEGGVILRRGRDGAFERMQTPGQQAVFGIWGSSPADMWAVGGTPGGASGAFAWRLDGERWVEAEGFPAELSGRAALWKVFGRGPDDVWIVGTDGNVLYWDGVTLEASTTGIMESMFTVHANSERFVTVGGFGTGLVLENDGSGWQDASPPGAPSFIGVCLDETHGYAVGELGAVYARGDDGWREEPTGIDLELDLLSLHSVWIDPQGGVWSVGGKIRSTPLTDGVMLHRIPRNGTPVPRGDGS
jgi:hypothetical protein